MTAVRNRSAFEGLDAVDVRCQCGKRLARLWAVDRAGGAGVDGVEYVKLETAVWTDGPARHGIKNFAKPGWRRIVCPKCSRDWRGDESQLVGLVRSAIARGSDRATLA